MKLGELLSETSVSAPDGMQEIYINGITNDSRKVKKDWLFVAIDGFESDGHTFVPHALEAGAAAVITEKSLPRLKLQSVLVNSTGSNRKLLADLSAAFFRRPWMELITVGITGTNGKTSTAHMLRWILENNGVRTGIMGTVGHVAGGLPISADVTTPDSLEVAAYMRRMADAGDRACVMEVSSHALALERVSCVRFDAAVFTNISQDHLDFHKDMNEYLETKKKLFTLLKEQGRSVVGTYAPGWPAISEAITFGEEDGNTWTIRSATSGTGGSRFTMQNNGERTEVSVKAPGGFNIYNAAGALATAVELGIPADKAASALSSFPGVPGRMESVSCGQRFLVAVDYAHTPDALHRVLEQGRKIAENRLIAVFGCGGDRDNRKRPIMGEIAYRSADIVIVTSDNPRTEDPVEIIREILPGFPSGSSPLIEPDRRKAIHTAIEMAEEGDVIIIAGKGHEDYQILGREKIHFDDREHAREALEKRGFNCGR